MELVRLERYRDIIDDWSAFSDAVQAPLPTTIWLNTLRGPRQEILARLGIEGIDVEPLAWYDRGFRVAFGARPGKTLAYVTGMLHIQEEVSMLPVVALDPQPGERILDLCAAPGNKTAQAAVHMNDSGTLVANDINHHRLGMVIRNVERIGLTHTLISYWNGANLPADTGKFHRVLADVPCSCEGTTRKNPDILWKEAHPKAARWPKGQTAILRKAVERCLPGGRIVYSTCTYAPEENESVVDSILDEFPDLQIVPVDLPGFQGSPGLVEWQGQQFRPQMRQTLRAYPHHNDTGGFFVAVLERAAETIASPDLPDLDGPDLDGPDPGDPGLDATSPQPAPPDDLPIQVSPPPLPGRFRRIEDVVDPVDGRRYVRLVEERFGIPRSVFEDYCFFRPTKDNLWIVDRDLLVPERPDPYSLGMPFFRIDMRFPRPTNAVACRFGIHATRHVLELTDDDLPEVIFHRDLELDADRAAAIDGNGYLFLRHRGLVIGLAYFRPARPDEGPPGAGIVKSMLPKNWTKRLGIQPPPRLAPPWEDR